MRCPKPITLLSMFTLLLLAAALSAALTRPIVVEAATPAGEPQAQQPAKPAPQPTAPAAPAQAPAAPQAGYVGTEVCATCHTGYDTSINASKHGFAKHPGTPAAAQGCETCHGPGEAYASDPEKIKPIQLAKLAAKEVNATCT